jgi:hypothetical protein
MSSRAASAWLGKLCLNRGIRSRFEVISPDCPSIYVNLGPHPPRLWPEDVDLLHDLWLKLSESAALGSKLHHRDIVGVALRRLKNDLCKEDLNGVIDSIHKDLRKSE